MNKNKKNVVLRIANDLNKENKINKKSSHSSHNVCKQSAHFFLLISDQLVRHTDWNKWKTVQAFFFANNDIDYSIVRVAFLNWYSMVCRINSKIIQLELKSVAEVAFVSLIIVVCI